MNRRNFLIRSALASSASLFPLLARSEKSRRDVIVGQSVDLSGPLQNLGRDYFTGAKIAFDHANASGGTAGRKWRFLQLDDGARPDQAVTNTARLLNESSADILFGFTGDECVEAVLASPAFKGSGRLMFAPLSGISLHKDVGRALYTRASYAEEIAALFGQFSEGRMSNFVIAHDASPASIATLDAAAELMSRRNIPPPSFITLKENGSNAASVAKSIARTPPHAIVILADTIATALLAHELRPRAPGMLIGMTSRADSATLQQILGVELSFGLIVSRVVPNPYKGTERVVREFSRTLAKYMDESPSATSLEGYLAARALIETTLRSADLAGRPESLQGMRTLELGDWSLTFGKGERASRYVDTSVITRQGTMLG